jgi:hypothetical protein
MASKVKDQRYPVVSTGASSDQQTAANFGRLNFDEHSNGLKGWSNYVEFTEQFHGWVLNINIQNGMVQYWT